MLIMKSNKWLNNKGFTLTEVMIGMMILTVAIVTATNLLVGLIGTNKNNVSTMQAFYFAQEGIEAVRNIRDSNWLHNKDWLSKDSAQIWGDGFEIGKEYSINLLDEAFTQMAPPDELNQSLATVKFNEIGPYAPWEVMGDVGDAGDVQNIRDEITKFKRKITFLAYEDEGCSPDSSDCANYIKVVSRVTWKEGAKDREFELQEILTNWKGGAL